MVYAVWGASEYVLLDQREIACNPRYYDMRHPWLSLVMDFPEWDDLTSVLIGCRIEQVELSERRLALDLRNGDGMTHLLEYLVNDERLPRQGNGEARRDAFKVGCDFRLCAVSASASGVVGVNKKGVHVYALSEFSSWG